ncbi:MAG: ATP-dependent zinc metalloprotease FtsH [Patescibacteria group bacterium]|jgi:cell division protease FtsH|nr:ATP-dependent zinc metalloprotease FtsH [Patescibacteria group bacterium]
MKKGNYKNIIYLIVVVLVLAVGYTYLARPKSVENAPISKVAEEVKAGNVKNISVNGTDVTTTLKDNKKIQSTISSSQQITTTLKDLGADPSKVTLDIKQGSDSSFWISILAYVLPTLLIVGLFYFMLRQAQGSGNQAMMFGKSQARLADANKKQVSFADVAGSTEAKQELLEIVEFLKYPQKFITLGAKIPKGVLLFGPPGTGKTLMARAVAGEAGVPFFSISGSEFVEMFVGVGASRVRDLFNKAKKNAPCIIFIDEIDAVGRQRGTGMGGSHDEREQTLNQILVEMDGFETDTNVIVIAATNRPDVLDPALLRPGRFDRRVILDMPDIKDRTEILKIHAKNKPLAKGANLEIIAKQTPGFSGADLQNILNESAILAARENKKEISMQDIEASVEKVYLGPERKGAVMNEREKKITAYHEAGHALIGHLLPNTDPIHKISIVSRGMALGVTWSLPIEDKKLISRSELRDDIAMMLGGRAAEKIFFNEITTGASNDLEKATQMARDMVTRYGMSDKLGNQIYGRRDDLVFLGKELAEHHKDYSEDIASIIDSEISRIINEAYKTAEKTINSNKKKLEKVANVLLEKETIESEEFNALMDKTKV